METLYPSSFMSNSSWLLQENHSTEWTKEENKQFERALAIYDEETPDRWLKVAAMTPGKTVVDVMRQYRELLDDVCEIEAGRVPIPGYLGSPFTIELVGNQNYDAYRKRPATVRGSDQERKKGVPWTEDEHKRFLMGLLKYGKGDWRNISRNFVVTKTPTQVASHAQKYYIRQLSGGKDKRRPSIHDITIVNLAESTTSDNNNNNKPYVFNESSPILPPQPNPIVTPKVEVNWNQCDDDSVMVFNPNRENLLMPSSSGIGGEALKLQSQDLSECAFHGAYGGFNNQGFNDCAFHGAYGGFKNQGFRTTPREFNKATDFGIHAL